MVEHFSEKQFIETFDAFRHEIPRDILNKRLKFLSEGFKQKWGDQYNYGHQNLDSLSYLWLIAKMFKPELIIEVGTCWGSSLSVWNQFKETRIHAIDTDFHPWYNMQNQFYLKFRQLTLHESCVSEVDFESILRGQRTLVFWDAHDFPEKKVFKPVLIDRVMPLLKNTEHIIALDDVAPVPADYKPNHEHFDGPYQTYDGLLWGGFLEVNPFVEWVNEYKAPVYKPYEILTNHGHECKTKKGIYFQVP